MGYRESLYAAGLSKSEYEIGDASDFILNTPENCRIKAGVNGDGLIFHLKTTDQVLSKPS